MLSLIGINSEMTMVIILLIPYEYYYNLLKQYTWLVWFVINVKGPWLKGLWILGCEMVVTVTPPLDTLTFAVDHLLALVVTVLFEQFGVWALICCEELKRVILLCSPTWKKLKSYFRCISVAWFRLCMELAPDVCKTCIWHFQR